MTHTKETPMLYEIESWITGSVLFSLECGSLKVCLEAAVSEKTDLSGAILSGADLSGANLSGAPVIPDIHQTIYAAASQPGALDMKDWHNRCSTAHCRAGWVVTLAGDAGQKLEADIGTPAAAALIYLASDPSLGKMPDFYCTNDLARAEAEAAHP